MSRREDINELFNEIREILSYLSITRVSEDVKFYIDGSENDALTFIQEITERISQFINNVYSEINSEIA